MNDPMRRARRWWSAALCLGLLCAVGVPARSQETPYEIDVVLSLTGGGAFLGNAQERTLQAAQELANQSGGIGGRPVRFVFADDQTSPQVAVQLFSALIAKRPAVVLGPTISATCSAVLPLVANGPLTYCFSPATHPPDQSFMFASNVSTSDFESVLMRYLHARRVTRIAFLATTDATGQDAARQIQAALRLPENRGITLVAQESFAPADVSVAAQMVRIKAAAPEMLVTGATGAPFATILRGIRDSGLAVPVVATGGNMTYAQMTQYRDILPAELLFHAGRGMTIERDASPAVRAAQVRMFGALSKVGIRPGFGELLAWDPAMLTIDALRRLGPNASAAGLHAYLERLHGWVGASGPYDFQKVPQRGIGAEAGLMYRWDAATGSFVAAGKPGGGL